jgi:hypothetical protein
MIPIEQTESGMLVFLNCGCSAWRLRAHPTGAAFLVQIIERACEAHSGGMRERVWSLLRGELVSPFVRERAS